MSFYSTFFSRRISNQENGGRKSATRRRQPPAVAHTSEITMDGSNADGKWFHEASSMFNDPSTDEHFARVLATQHSQGTTRAEDAQGTPTQTAIVAPRSRAVFVDRSILDSMAHLPRDTAAQMLGLRSTTFKKVCRRAGLKNWPYRRPLLGPLLGTIQEGDAPMSFSRRSPAPSAFPETHHLPTSHVRDSGIQGYLPTSRTCSSPGRGPSSAFSAFHAAAQQAWPPPPRCTHAGSLSMDEASWRHFPSESSIVFSRVPSPSSSLVAADGSMSYLAPSPAQTATKWLPTWLGCEPRLIVGHQPSQTAGRTTHVVDAVMDYLAPSGVPLATPLHRATPPGAPTRAPQSSEFGRTDTRAQAPCRTTHVVDAVMDYLDSLTGSPPAKCRAAVHLCELEAVADGLDLEG